MDFNFKSIINCLLFLVDQAVNKLLLSPVIHLEEIITYILTYNYAPLNLLSSLNAVSDLSTMVTSVQ